MPRHLENFRDFFNAKTAEKAQLNDLAPTWVEGGEPSECIVERDEILFALGRSHEALIEADGSRSAAALLVSSRAGDVDEDSAHQTR